MQLIKVIKAIPGIILIIVNVVIGVGLWYGVSSDLSYQYQDFDRIIFMLPLWTVPLLIVFFIFGQTRKFFEYLFWMFGIFVPFFSLLFYFTSAVR